MSYILDHILIFYIVLHYGIIIPPMKRTCGLSISSEYVNSGIDRFEKNQRKLIYSLRGRLYRSLDTIIVLYVASPYSMFASPLCEEWNSDTLFYANLKKCGA